jgi:hypothetical protein
VPIVTPPPRQSRRGPRRRRSIDPRRDPRRSAASGAVRIRGRREVRSGSTRTRSNESPRTGVAAHSRSRRRTRSCASRSHRGGGRAPRRPADPGRRVGQVLRPQVLVPDPWSALEDDAGRDLGVTPRTSGPVPIPQGGGSPTTGASTPRPAPRHESLAGRSLACKGRVQSHTSPPNSRMAISSGTSPSSSSLSDRCSCSAGPGSSRSSGPSAVRSTQ